MIIRQIALAGEAIDEGVPPITRYDIVYGKVGQIYLVNKVDNGWGIAMGNKYTPFKLVLS